LSLSFLLFPLFCFMLFIVQTLQSLEEGFPPLFVEHGAHADKFSCIIPFIVAYKNM